MLLALLKSKITPAPVMQTELEYEGSMTIDEGLMGDRVTVLSCAQVTEEEAQTWKTNLVRLDDRNRAIR